MKRAMKGFSLIEIVVVLAILAATAGLVVPLLRGTDEDAKATVTTATLTRVRDVIMGSGDLPSYYGDMRAVPGTVRELFVSSAPAYDKNTRLGWRGPYLQSNGKTYEEKPVDGFTASYGSNGDPAIPDGWNNPIIIQIPANAAYARVISAGPDGIIQTPLSDDYPLAGTRGDDLVLFLRRADVP